MGQTPNGVEAFLDRTMKAVQWQEGSDVSSGGCERNEGQIYDEGVPQGVGGGGGGEDAMLRWAVSL